MRISERLETLRDAIPSKNAPAIQICNDTLGYIAELELIVRETDSQKDMLRQEIGRLRAEMEFMREDVSGDAELRTLHSTIADFQMVLHNIARCPYVGCTDCRRQARVALGVEQ